MDDRNKEGGNEPGLESVQSEADESSTLLPMLIAGLVLIVIGMVFVMWLT